MKDTLYKLGFALYWFLFAVLAIFSAQYPGFVSHPEQISFPWLRLFVVWGILAVLVGVYYFILKPASGSSLMRVTIALLLSGATLTACVMTFYTDMDGLYYVPSYFSLLTTLILLVMFVARAGYALWQKSKGTS